MCFVLTGALLCLCSKNPATSTHLAQSRYSLCMRTVRLPNDLRQHSTGCLPKPILLPPNPSTNRWFACLWVVIGGGCGVSDRAGRKGCLHVSPFSFQWMLYEVMKFTHWCTISNRSWNQQQVRHSMGWLFPELLSVPEPRRQSVALLGNVAVCVLRADHRGHWPLSWSCHVEPVAVLTACFTWPVSNGSQRCQLLPSEPPRPLAALPHACHSCPILCMVGREKERGIKRL